MKPKKKMNFIFFFPDEMRAESLFCYGHPIVQTPNYDKLARQGVRFNQCSVQHTVCSPSRCSLMTGLYPHNAGHRTLWHLLRPHEPSLFRYLKKEGYRIHWYGKNDLYSQEYLKEILGHQEEAPQKNGSFGIKNPFRPEDPEYFSFLYEPVEGDVTTTETASKVGRAIDFLRSPEAGEQPFFLFLPTSIPHPPYAVPEPYQSMYNPADLPDLRPADLEGKPEFYQLIRQYRNLDRLPEQFFKKIQAVYLGMISYADRILGELLQALDDSGLADTTTVIVSSDHGDWAGDYGLVEKWPSGLDDTLTRVPLIIRSPGNKAGHVVKEQVELFDIMPTVLELAGIEPEHTHFAQSLVPQLLGNPGDKDRAAFAEGGYDLHEPHCFEGDPLRQYGDQVRDSSHIYYPKGKQQQDHPESVCRTTMIRTLDFKLVRRTADINELYDLRNDPLELKNVYEDPEYREVKAGLEFRLLDWYIRTSDSVPVQEDPRGFGTVPH